MLHGPRINIAGYAFMDEGSTVTLLDSETAKQLGVEGPRKDLTIQTVGGKEIVCMGSTCISVGISDKRSSVTYNLSNVHTVKDLQLPHQSLRQDDITPFNHLKDIEIYTYSNARPVILLGQDNWELITPSKIQIGTSKAPVASYTALGWVVHGCILTPSMRKSIYSTHILSSQLVGSNNSDELTELVRANFRLEAIGVCNFSRKHAQEERAERLLKMTTRRVDGRWATGLLWKDEAVHLPNNYQNTFNRLKMLEKKMDKSPEYSKSYTDLIQNLINNGYATKIQDYEETDHRVWYLPHFSVCNPNKPRKLRLVFDAAARTQGISLNDVLLKGPDLLTSLLGVLMRFRQKPVAFIGDIQEMFLQIKIHSNDCQAQRFLWRGTSRDRKPDVYCMTSMIFGATSSPCSAMYVKNINAQEFEAEFPQASKAIVKKHYMDDYLDSVDTEDEAIKLIREVGEIHRRGGFEMRGWASNSLAVLSKISANTPKSSVVQLTLGMEETQRTLGLKWDTQSDTFGFDVSLKRIPQEIATGLKKPTKREMLRVMMSVFDPLGFLAPLMIRSKILLQEIWRSGINWDDQLQDNEFKKWQKWTEALKYLKDYSVPRCYILPHKRVSSVELHMFCDASENAYAAVGYWRVRYQDATVDTTLIASKSRVAPLKLVSIPRLELQAAVLSSRLAHTIQKEHETPISRRIFWTDSKIVLSWIRSDIRKFKAFEAHRLGEIDELTDVAEWKWIPSEENPADDATRDRHISFGAKSRWFRGPPFLRKHEGHWPEHQTEIPELISEEMIREETISAVLTVSNGILPDIQRFSSWRRLIRATAWVLLFPARCRGTAAAGLSCEYIQRAEELWIHRAQNDSFQNDIHTLKEGRKLSRGNRLLPLTPVIDDKSIMRLGGRIAAIRDIEPSVSAPVILDGRHAYTKLLILHYHQQMGHGSTEMVINELRQKYWVLKLRPTVRSVSHKCQICRIRRAKAQQPRMGDLPVERLAHHQRPFTYTGMDYFGPMMVTVGRRHEKRWGVLFTCLTTRAIHLEVAHSLSTDATIMALRRMATRCGFPSLIYSDNGTNMRGADAELRRAIQELDTKNQETFAANLGIKWKFIPPGTPHMGGSWERLIKSVKTALKATLKERAPKEETLRTLLAEAERTVNSRPLTHVSVDPRDPESLTPYHFLIGTSSIDPIPVNAEDIHLQGRKQWRIAQTLANHFWRRWIREYLPTLLPRHRWREDTPSLQVGAVVVIADYTLPRNMWIRGIVTATYPGKDGRVRVADIRTTQGILRRPATKIIVLPTKMDGA